MSQREDLEACLVKHNQVFANVHEKFTEQLNAESVEALRKAFKTIGNHLETDHMERSSKMKSAFDELSRTLHETGIAVYDATQKSLEDKDLEITTLRQEYEAKLKAKDEEIQALKESVHDLRESRRDKDDMIATTKEMNKFLLTQLQDRKEPYEPKDKNMLASMAEQQKKAELQLQNQEAELRTKLLEKRKKSQAEVSDRGPLSERIEADAQTTEDPMETIVAPLPTMNRKQGKWFQEYRARELNRWREEMTKAEDVRKFVLDFISTPPTKREPFGRF
ncbi:hypothetical protein FNYG_01377 [Fusarium nygamai]|uniref:Uncharacterized protein n=1 Tax=Gibberella nygamai TaxID=42673 RepID=A0A2K0WS82_GIBNY|nr:hypothetical protein FNYG_01377 [Fusarium nygamai]